MTAPPRRLAFRVAYDGTRFSGSQAQPPPARTVHGELARGLARLGHSRAALHWAGRTDAGVSAAANVVALDAETSEALLARFPLPDRRDALLSAWSQPLSDAWVWAVAEVPEDFRPRHARARAYRYHLRTDLPEEALLEALGTFVGRHDFSSFARLEEGVDPVREVTHVGARREGPFVVVDVEGPNFLWNQVRRMVEAARRVAAGEIAGEALAAALRGARADFGVAAPEPLVLLDVRYDGVDFAPGGDVAPRRVRGRWVEAAREKAILQDILSQLDAS